MKKHIWAPLGLAALLAASAAAQDAQSALRTAATTMGMNDMKSIQYTGTGWQGMVGQSYQPIDDWPRTGLKSYTRTIDFDTMSSKEEYVRSQGTYSTRGGGLGFPFLTDQKVTSMVRGKYAWNLNAQGQPVPALSDAEIRQMEIYLTPWGFIKGAMAAGSNATIVRRWEYDERISIVSFVALGKYRINGSINAKNLIQRVQTWVPNPVVGDMYIEIVYTNYKPVGGIQFPRFHQHYDYDNGDPSENVSGGDHAFGLETVSDVKLNVANAALTVPANVQSATVPPVRVTTTKLGDGIWLMGGGSHNSVVVEFADEIVVIEAPLDEERSLKVIDEIYKLVPNKPIKYIVNTHHHWDHLGGIRTYVHEGATVVTHENNKAYYREVLHAGPWLLKPDRYSLAPPEEWFEGYVFETVGEKYVFADDNKRFELHNVEGLGHALGMLIAYFPKEKIVVQADMFNAGAPANASTRTFYNTIKRLNLKVDTIVGIHGNPAPMSALEQAMAQAK